MSNRNSASKRTGMGIGSFVRVGLLSMAAAFGALPARAAKNINVNYTLTQDEDWSSSGNLIIAKGKTIDLAGHTLSIKKIEEQTDAATITSSKAGGVLNVTVSSGSVRSRYVQLTGSLKLVKRGSGTYWPGKNNTYNGGVQVRQGTLKAGGSSTLGSGDIRIESGATLELTGTTSWHGRKFILNGGTLQNTTAVTDPLGFYTQVADVVLYADSTINFSALSHGFMNSKGAVVNVDLCGYSLNLTLNGVCCNALFTQGTVNQHGDMIFFKTASDATAATFNSYNPIVLSNVVSVTFGDFVNYATEDFSAGYNGAVYAGGNVYVTKSFKPVGDCFRGCTLKSGATLDLSERTGTWSTTSTTQRTLVPHELLFEDGATINVDVAGRTFACGDRIVAWNTKPQNVTFLSPVEVGAFVVEDDGLYYTKPAASAVWTGLGDPGNLHDPANWTCFDSDGQLIENAVPSVTTTVRLTGTATPFSVPANRPLAVKAIAAEGPVALTGDLDWRGLSVVSQSEMAIDLNGHTIYLSDPKVAGTIADSHREYLEVEYIESSGTQYVDTGYTHDENTKVDLKVQFANLPGGPRGWNCYYGSRIASGSEDSFSAWIHTREEGEEGSRVVTYHESGVSTVLRDAVDLGEVKAGVDYLVHLEKNGTCTIDGRAFDIGVGGSSGLNDYLFALNQQNQASNHSAGRLYFCKIYSGTTLVRDFVPAVKVSTGECGLIDRANNNAWCGNGGTDAFARGAVVQSTGAFGEVHFDIPSGMTAKVDNLTLAGALKVVKEGAGLLTFAKANQTFLGGVEVSAGGVGPGTENVLWLFGGASNESGSVTSVTVHEGARLYVNGATAWDYTSVVLGGGTVYGSSEQFNASLLLSASSALQLTNNLTTTCSVLDLGGHTLSVNIPAGRSWRLNHPVITNGVMDVIHGGWVVVGRNTDARTVDWKVSGGINLQSALSVHDYEANFTSAENRGDAALKVFGTFTPTTDYFYGCAMQDGSTINLSAKDGVWFAQSLSDNKNVVTFADGATVYVSLGDRQLGTGDQIILWNEKPTRVKFLSPEGGRFSSRQDGLYVPAGFMIFLQ